MMNALDLLQINLLSPVVLAFYLGVLARLLRSDLEFPEQLYSALSIYLLMAIGLKGGVALSVADLDALWLPAVGTLLMGCAIPVWCYAALRRIGRFSVADSAAVAAHYGSCSVVTFIAATTFMKTLDKPAEGFLPSLVALLEVPAIIVALMIARLHHRGGGWGGVLHEVAAGRSVLLLVGGLAIGWLVGPAGFEPVRPFFVDPFSGLLTLFMLEMGMVAGRSIGDLRRVGPFLTAFAVVLPTLHGLLGAWVGQACGLSIGGATALGVLAASASYIAAPAAVRVGIPDANPALYVTASLAITFPYNLSIGIPLYYRFAEWLYAT